MSNKPLVVLVAAAGLAVLVFLFLSSLTAIPAGHVGVVTVFGKVEPEPLDSGLHLVPFWKGVHKMSVQTQEDKERAEVPTKEGMTITLECSILYSLQRDKAVEVYKTIGENYKDVVVTPQFRSALRGATVKYEASDLYTAAREQVEETLEKDVKGLIEPRGIKCEKVLMRTIELPPTVKTAIDQKLAADQAAKQMVYVLQKAEQEAKRVKVEAKGIAESQEIIHATLTDSYLRYLWIKGLQEASNHGATLIYVPTGSDGMPMFKEVSPPRK